MHRRRCLFLHILSEVPAIRKRPEPEKKVPVAVPKKVEAPPTIGIYCLISQEKKDICSSIS